MGHALPFTNDAPPSPRQLAESAGLRYTSDDAPGFSRRRHGRGFSYRHPDGTLVKDRQLRAKFESLAIPPAWTDVWISPDPLAHLLATGRDLQVRKQYLYHPKWREAANLWKFERLPTFGRVLPKIRKQAARDLARKQIDRRKVLGLVVTLLDRTLIRVGHAEYRAQNGTHGLTTLCTDHVDIDGRRIEFHFVGKSGQEREVELVDRKLARMLDSLQDFPGEELFQYPDDNGSLSVVEADEVNAYLSEAASAAVTAKDFRTWGGSTAALKSLLSDEVASEGEAEVRFRMAIRAAAETLGNTEAVCREYYVHPALAEANRDGDVYLYRGRRCRRGGKWLDADERRLLTFLEERRDAVG